MHLEAAMRPRPLRWLTTNYHPDPSDRPFLERLKQQQAAGLKVSVAVLSDRESVKFFGVHLARRGVQPVWIEVENHSGCGQRLDLYSVDPCYYTPLEAASINHFSVGRRLLSFGILGWLFLFLLPLLPSKLITARNANRRMSALFKEHALRGGTIPSGTSRSGVVFTSLDEGLKSLVLRFVSESDVASFNFSLEIPGLLIRPMQEVNDLGDVRDVTLAELMRWSVDQPQCTTGKHGSRDGDPLNLLVVGNRDLVRQCFGTRWDDAEAINWATSLKTAKAFLLDSAYRYSPVSSLYVHGRVQDLALQRARASINERVHLRLWRSCLTLEGNTVWIGQVSRDIGVRFTLKTWNLTTHRIDPDVDESRDYVVDSLADSSRLSKFALVPGCGSSPADDPRRNLTGDPYFTDGSRALLILSATGDAAEFVPSAPLLDNSDRESCG
ncbi:LssY C-terminal domain-containing protein [bacterium]|nr:LssY C-terminal domain-containing protein [bacterium]